MKNKIKDNSGDKKYFIVTPRLAWLLSRTPYDLSFWTTVKDIAGDDGECRITTKELAVLCMMSIGKVSECREYWISVGLLDGQREKEPNERNAIWHLSVPDFWEKNIEESKAHKTLKSRIEFKKKQQIELRKTVSCGETVTVSPGEKGSSPHEIDYTPGETVYLYREEPNRRTKEDIAPKNGAAKSVNLKVEKDNFVVLLDFWYSEKGEPNPGTVPPRFDRKKYTELVAERINEGRTWHQLSAAVRNYWRVVKSPAHYYKHQGSISWFVGKGIDNFWDELKPWENFKDKKNGAPSVGYNSPPEDLSELTLKEFGLA